MPNKPTTILLILICLAALFWFFHESNTGCNVAYLKLHGDVVTYIPVTDSTTTSSNPVDETASEDITKQIRDANRDSHIKAIVLEIDSPGGSPVGGEEMELALKHSQKPTVAK